MRWLLQVVAVVAMTVFFVAGCSKQKETAESPKPQEGPVSKKETVVKVPEKIKGKWKAVTLAVKEKSSGKVQTFSLDLGSSVAIPGSDFSVQAINFFPHFVMEGINLTSKSNETKNPAVEIRLYQKDKEIYHGWLFANYPTTNIPKQFNFDLGLIAATPADKG